jgi:Flp pilus assembly protein TadG
MRPLSARRDAATLERGSAAVELVLLAPLLVALLVFVVYAGRITQANARVHHAADQAARAASMVSRARSGSVAAATATAELTSDGVRCASSSIASSRSSAAGLDAITVTVSCTIDGSDLAPLAPGRRTVVASSTEVIDVFRAEEP